MKAHIGFASFALLLLAAPLALGATPWRSEGRLRDSDDWVCHHGPLEAARTLEACGRLQAAPASIADVMALRQGGLARDSDDLNCLRGRPGEAETVAACDRLRGD